MAAGSNAVSTAAWTLAMSTPAGGGPFGTMSPIGHGVRLRIGTLGVTDRWREEDVRFSYRQRHAALAGDALCHPHRAIRHRHLDRLLLPIDLRCPQLRALFIGRGEVADVLRRERRVESGDKDRACT